MLTDVRLACHQLTEPKFEKPEELVAWMGAIQAQDYTMSKWAIGVRLKSSVLEQVNDALAKGKIVRTHIMRPTWHYVAGKDLQWMQQLTALRVKKAIDGWVKSSGLDISEELYSKCNDQIGKMLSGGRCLTREEIEMELERAGILTADDRVRRYILRAEMEGIVCSGADKAGKPSYALQEEQVDRVPALHREEALARLALRYFRSHSPATLKDFVWWSGLTMTEARKAIGLIDGELVAERFGELEFWVYTACREVTDRSAIHFLPPYDEYLLGYKDRATVIPVEHHPKAFNRWGIFYPVIVSGGQLVGNWNKSLRKGDLTITTSFFQSKGLRRETGKLLEAENKCRAFYGFPARKLYL